MDLASELRHKLSGNLQHCFADGPKLAGLSSERADPSSVVHFVIYFKADEVPEERLIFPD